MRVITEYSEMCWTTDEMGSLELLVVCDGLIWSYQSVYIRDFPQSPH